MLDKMHTQDKMAERARFEQWYTTHAFNYSRDPIGSRDCSMQWEAWDAALQAQVAEAARAAEPVYQYQDTPDSWVDCDYDLYNASGDPKRILYTRPQPAQDAKDGARYRWLRDFADSYTWGYLGGIGAGRVDATIDAAMAKEYGR